MNLNSPHNRCDITSQTLNNSNLHYFIIIRAYPILFCVIIQKCKCNGNCANVLILWSVLDTFNNCIVVSKTSP